MYDEKRLELELNNAKNLSQVVAVVAKACDEIQKSAVLSISIAFKNAFNDKPLHSIFYCASLGLTYDDVTKILESEDKDKFTRASQLVVNQLVAKSRIDDFPFSNSIDVMLVEAPFLVFAFNLKLKGAIKFAENFDESFRFVIHYFPLLARKKNEFVNKVDKWGDVDESQWEKLLIDFTVEKLKLDEWLWFVLNPKVKNLSVGKHFNTDDLDSVGVKFTKMIVNTALDDKESFLDFNSPFYDVNPIIIFNVN
jgi:hypothetical protein